MSLHLRHLLLAFAVALAPAGDGRAETGEQDALWGAVKRGEIRSLADLIGIVREKLPGEITGVEIEREHGRWVYEFHVVDRRGRLLDVHVDAHSGEISRIKER
jgi:uncharacterized membrane protein YkoI